MGPHGRYTGAMERRLEAPGRREYTLTTFWHSVRAPRRISGRRSGDRRYTVMDRVEPGVAILAIALMTMSLLDSVFTLTLLAHGGKELNPFMDILIQTSTSLFTSTKMAMTAIPAIILVATANLLVFNRIRARTFLAAMVGVYAGLMVYHLILLSHIP